MGEKRNGEIEKRQGRVYGMATVYGRMYAFIRYGYGLWPYEGVYTV